MTPTPDNQQPTQQPGRETADEDDPDMEYVQVVPTEEFIERARQASEPEAEDASDQ